MAEPTAPLMVDLDPATVPLEEIDVSQRELWSENKKWPFFKRLRDEAPVHYCKDSEFGPYWSVTRYEDIMEVEQNWKHFSSDPTIVIQDPEEDFELPMFIAMDPPKHDEQRKTVPGVVAPQNLKNLEGTIVVFSTTRDFIVIKNPATNIKEKIQRSPKKVRLISHPN